MSVMLQKSNGLRTLRDEMDRVFDTFFLTPSLKRVDGSIWAPAVDLKEDTNNFIVSAELPGLKREDIQVEIENNTLMIKGERKFEKKEEKENYHFVERSYGSFYRSFTLPKNVDAEKISAEYKDGVLHVTLPKREEVKPKKVEVKI
jgi:HSP20 family protein